MSGAGTRPGQTGEAGARIGFMSNQNERGLHVDQVVEALRGLTSAIRANRAMADRSPNRCIVEVRDWRINDKPVGPTDTPHEVSRVKVAFDRLVRDTHEIVWRFDCRAGLIRGEVEYNDAASLRKAVGKYIHDKDSAVADRLNMVTGEPTEVGDNVWFSLSLETWEVCDVCKRRVQDGERHGFDPVRGAHDQSLCPEHGDHMPVKVCTVRTKEGMGNKLTCAQGFTWP